MEVFTHFTQRHIKTKDLRGRYCSKTLTALSACGSFLTCGQREHHGAFGLAVAAGELTPVVFSNQLRPSYQIQW